MAHITPNTLRRIITVKKLIFAAALIAALIPFAAAEEHHAPQANLDREVDVRVPAVPAVLGNPPHAVRNPAPPPYCKPCLFYAGDFDSNASDANGLANELDTIISSGAAVWVPIVPTKKKVWSVTDMFSDNFASLSTLDPATSPYGIRTGVKSGSGGKLLAKPCSGTAKATNTDTGLSDFGYEVYATQVKFKDCKLKGGTKYWFNVIAECTGSECSEYRAFTANDDGAMNHKFGPAEPANDSFFNSVFFSSNWEPSSEQQSSSRYSAGLSGKLVK